jgi:ABC-type multidrug transport system fused ATPase/permease subunit
MVMIGEGFPVPEFRHINIKKDSNNSIKMDWKRYNYFIMSLVSLFGFLILAVIYVIGAFIITGLLVGILATFNLFEGHTQTIGNLTFGVLLLLVIIKMASWVRSIFSSAGNHWLSISKDKITAKDLEISIDDILRIEYSVDEVDEGGLPESFNLYGVSIVDKSEETVFEMIASNHDGALLIEYLKNILQVEISLIVESENNNQEDEMKKIRKAEYHDWDSKSLSTWLGDYLAKFLPRSILAIITVLILFALFGNGIENWN